MQSENADSHNYYDIAPTPMSRKFSKSLPNQLHCVSTKDESNNYSELEKTQFAEEYDVLQSKSKMTQIMKAQQSVYDSLNKSEMPLCDINHFCENDDAPVYDMASFDQSIKGRKACDMPDSFLLEEERYSLIGLSPGNQAYNVISHSSLKASPNAKHLLQTNSIYYSQLALPQQNYDSTNHRKPLNQVKPSISSWKNTVVPKYS